MTATNRVRLSSVKELTLGVTPGSPRMRAMRYTSDTLKGVPTYLDSNEIRSDRMMSDAIPTTRNSGGEVNGEFSYPVQDSPLAVDIESAMFSAWAVSASRFNDGVADSVISNVDGGTSVISVSAGGNFAVGHLVQFAGFGTPANNAVRRCSTASTTVPAFAASGLVTEAVPPANARMKVVGFQGAAGDITTTATGLGSTALDFTTLGLAVGQWIKIGGTTAIDRFATAAVNDYVRITAITATALTLDNRPASWAVDAGTAKTIKVWTGDFIKNGTTRSSQTIEKGFMGQITPSYLTYLGMVNNTMNVSLQRGQVITYAFGYMGMSSAASTTSIDAIPDSPTLNSVMAAHAHVGRINEGGVAVAAPNWMAEFTIDLNNNCRYIEALDSQFAVSIEPGECTVTGTANTYFGDLSVYNKFLNGTPTNLNSRVARNNQAVVWDIPRAIYREGGDTPVTGKNADVMLNVGYQSSFDETTQAHITCTRMEYVE